MANIALVIQMRAMAILFIGPHRNPDFANDYHLSPLLAPGHLLARFPPLLMTCGEKDPFVDDTVIFAGRVRDAKRSRRRELEAALAGKSVKFGEQLRMSMVDSGSRDDPMVRAMKRELNELAGQTEEDWVQMLIFTEWSHGYMQMPRLMKEAGVVVDFLGDWMDGVFVGQRGRVQAKLPTIRTQGSSWRMRRGRVPPTSGPVSFQSETELETETDDQLTFSPRRSPRPPARRRSTSRNSRRGSNRSDGSPGEETASSSSATLVNGTPHLPPGTPHFPPRLGSPMLMHSPQAVKQGFGSPAVATPNLAQRMPTPTLGGNIKVGSPSMVTESEMMRRRRLLDSHLIHSDAVKDSDSP